MKAIWSTGVDSSGLLLSSVCDSFCITYVVNLCKYHFNLRLMP